jgi:hypothetical protein
VVTLEKKWSYKSFPRQENTKFGLLLSREKYLGNKDPAMGFMGCRWFPDRGLVYPIQKSAGAFPKQVMQNERCFLL